MLPRRLLATFAIVIFCESLAGDLHAAEPVTQRWLYLQQNLQVAENIPKIEQILRRAAKVGYNGVVLADYKLNILDRVPNHYFKNAERFKAICKELNLEIIPTVTSFGYSDGILAHNPNLAEGLPVKHAPFVVREGIAVPAGHTQNLVPGDFEQFQRDQFKGWSFQDEAGSGTFVDTAIKHGGQASLRIQNARGGSGNRRVSKRLEVRPWTQFHASVWIRTEDFESAGDTRMFTMTSTGKVLSHSSLGVQKTQDWTQHHIVFNSLDDDDINFYVGAWDCQQGKLWMDDVQLVEEPFVNLVRRSGCPLVVQDAASKTTYEEGRDFEKLADPKLGTVPYEGSFEVYHAAPQLKLTKDSGIRDGQQLRVSFYHTVTIHDNQVCCSLTDPQVFEIVTDQVQRVQKLFEPKTYFLSHDEIRVANWSEPDQRAKKSAGVVLAENVRQCVKIIRQVNPQAKLCIWSDMFDPHHNAHKDFYLVNGDLAGSWEGFPKDMQIVNWNSGKPDKSLPFFANRGHSQILAGYYDGPVDNIRKWQAAGKNLKGVNGAMYTTWQSNFADIEKFAEAAWGGGR